MGFVAQMIIEKASAGHDDHVKAALDLFVDFVAVLVRLTLILVSYGCPVVCTHFPFEVHAMIVPWINKQV